MKSVLTKVLDVRDEDRKWFTIYRHSILDSELSSGAFNRQCNNFFYTQVLIIILIYIIK